MQRLKHSELESLSKALLELYTPGEYLDLPSRVLRILHNCFSFELGAYHEISGYENERMIIEPDEGISLEVFTTYLRQHPSWTPVVEGRIASPVKISDFASQDRWRRTDLYNGFFRPVGQNYQLAFITLSESPQLGVALNRSTHDFSEEERMMLDLLRPHLGQAFKTSKLFSYLSGAAEGKDEGFIVSDCQGKIRFATPKAVRWLESYFGAGSTTYLPDRIRGWLKNRMARALADNDLSLPINEFSTQAGAKRLVIESLSAVQDPEQRLILREVTESPDAVPLESLGLTKRQAEVLFWVSQGKRNAEIAAILGTTAKTITKHLERVFERLGVETRTGAANVALGVLGRSYRSA